MKISNYLLAISILINILFIATIANVFYYYEEHTVYDMDLVRNQYMKGVRYYYNLGCTTGTDYPQEFRKPIPEFNENTPINWCIKQKHENEENFLEDMYKLGRINK